MTDRTPLHVVFTMDCQPASQRGAPDGPKSWNLSARAIDAFCGVLHDAGYPATLFFTPSAALMHEPLIADMRSAGADIGLYVQPQSLEGGRYTRHLGQYGPDDRRSIIMLAMRQLRDITGERPRSVRSALHSASDATFSVLASLGFRQGSISSPGRRVAKHGAVWTGAERHPHYASSASRLACGDLAFLEVPVTTDADQTRDAIAPDLVLEHSAFADWHQPLIARQLQRMDEQQIPFRALCLVTSNIVAYHEPKDRPRKTLDALLDYLADLERGPSRYVIQPATLSSIHAHYRAMMVDRPQLMPR